MATFIAKMTDLRQYDATSSTIVWSDPTSKTWADVYSKVSIGDNCIFLSGTDLYVGDFASSIKNSSITFNNIKSVKITTDDLLRIDVLNPETLAVLKRPRRPMLRPTLNVNDIYNAAISKDFISFYIVKQGQEGSLTASLKANDRVVTIDQNNKVIEIFIFLNGHLQPKSFPAGYFNAKGRTLSDIADLMRKAGKPNHLLSIQRIMGALGQANWYKFPSFNSYYNVIHNKGLYAQQYPAEGKVFDDDLLLDDLDDLNDIDDTEIPKNIILYGPPGTGKTFHSISYAVAIVENKNPDEVVEEANTNRFAVKKRFDEYIDKGLIVFTTFHQSMSYEDFIEGIKPLPPGKDQNLKYDIVDGIFKSLCSKAESNWFSSNRPQVSNITFEAIFEEFQDQWESEKQMKFAMKTVGKEFTITGFSNKSIYFKKANGGEGHTLSINTLKDIYYEKRQPWENGVGIYYPGIIEKLKNIAPLLKQTKTKPESYVIIIDEINRGNVSQIFGELITLIEVDKRIGCDEALKVTLPYSKDAFGVPQNLYIIGTMNTADRSVEALDTALRRRFSFVPKMPEENTLRITGAGIDLPKLLQTINNRLRVLKDNDHTIGHAWLWNVSDLQQLKDVFENKILPLLQEYFYNDYEKLGLVLGDAFFELPHKRVAGNEFAAFSGSNGLSGQYRNKYIYKLKNPKYLEEADFSTLTQAPVGNED